MPKVEFQRCVVVDGKAYATIAEAQVAILTNILDPPGPRQPWDTEKIVQKIITEREFIMAALTLADSSRPSARKAFGAAKKSRKSKPTVLPEPETA